MIPNTCPVTFQPKNVTVHVLPGTSLPEAAGRAGLTLDAPCGGAGTCGKCRVQIIDGEVPVNEADRALFSEEELAAGWRLACQTRIDSKLELVVPSQSLFADQHQILTRSETTTDTEVLPAVRKIYVEMTTPGMGDDDADLARLSAQVGPIKTSLPVLRSLPQKLRDNHFKGTAVLTDHSLIDFEAGDTTQQCYGVAIDLGTTTIVATLLSLVTGDECAVVSRMNPQTKWGDDVLARIMHASSDTQSLAELRDSATAEIAGMIAALCERAAIEPHHIYEVTLAGNTTMQHLICGLDPASLGQVPFVPVFKRGLMLKAADFALPIHPQGAVYIFPVIGGFVGGDTVAGMLATGLGNQEAPVIMVDIGTNGEIVLAHKGRILAASTAAGPAFEGARISCGMRATKGAIEKVSYADGDLALSTIGDSTPVGLCGSGLIDLVATLLDLGMIAPDGRLLPPHDLPATLSEALQQRVHQDVSGAIELVLSETEEQRVTFTEKDVRELQLASGAVRAGIDILLKQAELEPTQLERIYIAGGFGSFIRRSNAQRIGLLPEDVPHDRIRFVGNASLGGARWALLSTQARQQAEGLADQTRHVELSLDTDFAMAFALAMTFPDKDR